MLLDGMHFDDENVNHDWDKIGNDFCYVRNNKRINYFVRKMHEAKIETERKMR